MQGHKIIRNYHTHFKGEITETQRMKNRQFLVFVWVWVWGFYFIVYL